MGHKPYGGGFPAHDHELFKLVNVRSAIRTFRTTYEACVHGPNLQLRAVRPVKNANYEALDIQAIIGFQQEPATPRPSALCYSRLPRRL